MSNPRVENWVATQRQMVGPGAICVARVVLVGPEGDAWGTWAIDFEGLAEAIEQAILTQGEERAHGVYHAKLVGLDQGGDQIALLPVRIYGKAPQALGAGNEANALQKATGLAVNSLEQIICTQGNHVEKLAAVVDSLIEDRSILLEEFNKQQADNLDVELRRQEWMQQQQMKEEVWTFLKDQALPALLPAFSAWAENQEEERRKRKADSEKRKQLEGQKYPPGWPGPTDDPPPTATSPKTRDDAASPRASDDVAESSSRRMSPTETPQAIGELLSGMRAAPQKDQAGEASAPSEPSPGTRRASSEPPPPDSPTEATNGAGRTDHESTDSPGGDSPARPAKPQTDGPASGPRNVRPRSRSRQRKSSKR